MEKIIFILPSLKVGGGNRVIIEISNILVSNKIDVDIIYPNNSNELSTFDFDKRINLYPIGKFNDNKLIKLYNLLKVILFIRKEYKNCRLIFTDPISSIFTPLIDNNYIYRFIQADDYSLFDDLFTLKNKFILSIYKRLVKLSYSYNINYLFNSQYTYNRFIEVSKRYNIDCNIIHPAVNNNIFYNKNIRESTYINICIIARKHPMKGFRDFIESLKIIKNQDKINKIFVLSHDNLSDFNLKDLTVIRPKNDEEISLYLNKSHIFVSTSWNEGFGLPSLEAMFCGCTVLLTNAGGVNEYAIPNQNCLMYNPRDYIELSKKLELLINDSCLRIKLSNNTIKIVNEFSWKKSSFELLEKLKKEHK